jgi:tetraacyldisaccharide 4'-kinase
VTLLRLPAWIYRVAVQLRNRRYDRPGASVKVGLPVVSVGNLTVGGTGKTPIVIWLARRLREMGRRPAVVSRGYGGRAGSGPLLVSDGGGPGCSAAECGDEPFLMAQLLGGVPVIVGSDRAAGAELARRRGAQLVLLDDGFQHRRLARDLDIVLLDAGSPFGDHRLLPAGTLREPLSALRRADLILITRSPADESFAEIEQVVREHNRTVPILRAGHRPVGFVDSSGQPAQRPDRVMGFCGIGNPDRFRADLESMEIELLDFRPYPDHHRYSAAEIDRLRVRARELGAVPVTTEKDLARLGGWADKSLLALRIEAEVLGSDTLLSEIRRVLDGEQRR